MSSITHQDVLKWATSMGFSSSIPPEAFQKLLSPQMKPFWRQILTLVKPKSVVENIHKNILLNKLKPEVKKSHQKLSVKAEKFSQIPLIRKHEDLHKKLNKNNKEIGFLTGQVEDIQSEFKRMGQLKQKTLESIEEKKLKILILKEKEKNYRKKLELNSLVTAMESLRLPEEELNNQTDFFHSTMKPSEEIPSMINQLAILDSQIDSVSHNETLGEVSKIDKEMIHNYLMEHFQNSKPRVLLESVTSLLQKLSRDVAVAAAASDEMDTDRNDEISNAKSLEESLKEFYKSINAKQKEIQNIKNSAHQAFLVLQAKKNEVIKIMLPIVGKEYEEEIKEWLDIIVQGICVSEKIRVFETEINQVSESIESLEYSRDLFEKLNVSVQTCKRDIKQSTKKLKKNLRLINKNQSVSKLEFVKSKIFKKIEEFQNKIEEDANLYEDSNPLLLMKDYVSKEVSLLLKMPLESLQMFHGNKSLYQNAPVLPMFTPYTPAHNILQDNIVKCCLAQHSVNTLEELQPSPVIDCDVDKLIDDTIEKENKNNLVLEQKTLELNKILENQKKNLEQATENITFWIEQPVAQFIPGDILLEGSDFKTWKNKFSECLEK